MNTRVPPTVSKQVTRLAQRLAPAEIPQFVAVEPADGALPNECFGNVENQIAKSGGVRVVGWTIWEWPNTLVEAEFHAVWKCPSGRLIDVTPKLDGDQQILFLSDPRRSYSGEFVDNLRMPLREDAVIVDFIRMSEELVRVTRIGKPGEPVHIKKEDVLPLARRHELLAAMLKSGKRDHDLCFCNSGRKYKKCHALVPRA